MHIYIQHNSYNNLFPQKPSLLCDLDILHYIQEPENNEYTSYDEEAEKLRKLLLSGKIDQQTYMALRALRRKHEKSFMANPIWKAT